MTGETVGRPTTPENPVRRLWGHRTLIAGLLVILLVRTFLLQQFYISGPSMEQTLQEDDRVVVEKFTGHLRQVSRGDVIVFHHQTGSGLRELIKRVVGLPGETVEVRDCVVYVNGVLLPEPYLSASPAGVSGDCGGGTTGTITVPVGEVFVLGDNRPESSDSRSFGPVPLSSLVGRAVAVVWPPSAWQRL